MRYLTFKHNEVNFLYKVPKQNILLEKMQADIQKTRFAVTGKRSE